MSEEETRTLTCPFCGAPHKEIIPSGTMQVKCKYCGGIVLVPPWMSGKTVRCCNHPDRLANGICNDCGNNFCESCLNLYQLNTEHKRIQLYLCPECLRERYVKKAEAEILIGLFLAGMGVFWFFLLLPSGLILGPVVAVGLFFGLIGAGFILDGYFRRQTEISEESTLESIRKEEEKRKAEFIAMAGFDVENAYNKLVKDYIFKWGVSTGMQTLESEIAAYIRHGETFPAAVKKILQRQQKKMPSKF